MNEWRKVEDALPDSTRSVIARYNEMYADGIHKKYAVAFFGKFTGRWIEPMTGQHLDVDMWCEITLEIDVQDRCAGMIIHLDYIPSAKCNNTDTFGMICVKCGQCGRQFNRRGICTNIDEYPADNENQEDDESEVQHD